MKKRLLCLLLILLVLPVYAFSDGREGTSNYLYTLHREPVAAPPAYTLAYSLTARDYPDMDGLDGMVDAYVTEDAVYILCAKRLVVLNHDLSFRCMVKTVTGEDGTGTDLDACSGITVTVDGDIYITQSEKSRILHLNPDYTLKRIMERPVIVGYENVKYRPTKMVVDNAGRLYVISKGMYEGILELNADGTFTRFFGVNEVKFTPWQLLWRVFSTREQRARQSLWLPSDFTNLCIDQDGFLFATLLGSEQETVKRLNAKGENIIKVPTQQPYPSGDLWVNQSGFGIPTGPSQFIAVDTNDCGVYICLDSTRSRVFAYNEDHSLLFVFGGPGDREGYFRNPVDIAFIGDNILVLDALAQSIEIFSPTLYGQALMNAVRSQYRYGYETAAEYWQETLLYNHNFNLAYSGIGRMLLRAGRYEEAMEYLKKGEDRVYYDKAYEKVRTATMRRYFVPAVAAAAAILILILVLRLVFRKKKDRNPEDRPSAPAPRWSPAWFRETFLGFPFRLLLRPFKRFDEMKFEHRGSYLFAFTVLFLESLTAVMSYVYTGFLINYNDIYRVNSLYLALTVLFPVGLFVLGNWCVTTLLDGKGRLGEIFQVTMYAIFPMCLLQLLGLLLSNVLVLDEMVIVTALTAIGGVLFFVYLFIGLAVVHEYGFGRCIGCLLLTLLAMMVLVFILMLLFALVSDVVDFVTVLSKELMLKFF